MAPFRVFLGEFCISAKVKRHVEFEQLALQNATSVYVFSIASNVSYIDTNYVLLYRYSGVTIFFASVRRAPSDVLAAGWGGRC